MNDNTHTLRIKRMGIDTYQEAVVYMLSGCHVCSSEGFRAQSRVRIRVNKKSIIATLNILNNSSFLSPDEAGLSESAWNLLEAEEGEIAQLSHPDPVDSMNYVRSKVYGERLPRSEFYEIIDDIVKGKYTDIHLSSFITACANDSLNIEEIEFLTEAMIDAGDKLQWHTSPVVDKHCVGGLPGNRTTPIVVSIVTSCGLTMPKTSSRSITSPAGTADMMETITPVELGLNDIRRVVEKECGCIVWGGSVNLSPADDILIRVERALDLDSEGQLIASVLSKKKAAGSTHVILDIPVGPTAKVSSESMAHKIIYGLEEVGRRLGLHVKTVVTDGTQPVGRGIGPALEARDVLSVLSGEKDYPRDLRERSVELAAKLLEMSGYVKDGEGRGKALEIIDSGKAYNKLIAICEAQGGFREPGNSVYQHTIESDTKGTVISIDNHMLAKVAKLAGAPSNKTAGIVLHVKKGDQLEKGQPMITIHSEASGTLEYALEYVKKHKGIFKLQLDEW